MRRALGVVEFYGHPMVTATHPTTIEVTKESVLTRRGDCVIGVRADKSVSEIPDTLKRLIAEGESSVRLTLEVDSQRFTISARGDSRLSLEDQRDIVIRKSNYVCRRTVAILADAAAKDVPRSIIEKLKRPTCKGTLTIECEI